MMRLLRVELQRLRSRRVLLLALIGAALISLAAVWFVNQQAAQLERARAGADAIFNEQVRYWEENGEADLAMCLQDEEAERRRTGEEIDFGCQYMEEPTPENFYGVLPSLQAQYEQLLEVIAVPLLLVVLVLGSTHVAAEFSHRTMGSWLTFVPRRLQVYASKVLSAGLAALPIVALGVTLVLIGVPAVFRWHGIDDNVSDIGWGAIVWTAVRVLLLGGVAGMFGAALGFLVRHSAAVVGLVLAYAVTIEGMAAGLLPTFSRWTLGRNVMAVVGDGTEWTTWVCPPNGECRDVQQSLSFEDGLLTLSVIVGIFVILALWRFVRSDVD